MPQKTFQGTAEEVKSQYQDWLQEQKKAAASVGAEFWTGEDICTFKGAEVVRVITYGMILKKDAPDLCSDAVTLRCYEEGGG